MNDLTMTNVWLGILATISLIEFLMIAAAGLFAYRAYKQVSAAVETVERVHIAPLRARVDTILDEVEAMTGKVRHAQDSVSAVFNSAAAATSILAGSVRSKAWPIVGMIKGARTVVDVLRQKNGRRHDQPYITGAM